MEHAVICRICSKQVNSSDCEWLEGTLLEVLEVVIIKLNFTTIQPVICKNCSKKLLEAFEHKSRWIYTEDLLFPYVNSAIDDKVDIKTVYFKERNCEPSDIERDIQICRFCMKLISDNSWNSLRDVLEKRYSLEIFGKYVPELDLNSIRDPVICKRCLISLSVFMDFIALHPSRVVKTENCLEVEENTEHGLTNIKTEPQMVVFQSNETMVVISQQPFPHKILTCPGGLKMFCCLVCNQQMKRKDILKRHMVTHECSQNIPMFSCDSCSYKTKRKDYLNRHQIMHKDRADIKMFKCEICSYEATRKKGLTSHMISHKDLSEAVIYHCPSCSYQSKWRENILGHKIVHENPLTVTMYSCELCTYKTKRKTYLKVHKTTHQNRAEVATFACGLCSFKAAQKSHLKRHMLVHMDSNKVEMFKCDLCPYQAKYKNSVVIHKLTHGDPSEVNIFKCDECPMSVHVKKTHARSVTRA